MNLFRLFPALLLPMLSQAAFPTLYLKNVCDDQLHAPTNICHAGDGSGRLFICDQPGKIHIFKDGMLQPTPFLDLSSSGTNDVFFWATPSSPIAYTERGLLGMCFHPGYDDPMSLGYRCFYLNYTAVSTHPTSNPVVGTGTNCVSVIAEFKVSLVNPDQADPVSKRIVLTYGQPQSNHNGGQIEFGPDGLLYIASGDGGGSHDNQLGHTEGTSSRPASPNERLTSSLGNGQDRRTLLGKILRIDPLGTNGPVGTYGIPASNPFVGQFQDLPGTGLDGAMRAEIYAYGLRNPWRFSFDSSFGGAARLICADVGQLDVEEIDFITSGGNYGWRMNEGSVAFDTIAAYGGSPPAVIAPIAEYAHPNPISGPLAGHGTLTGTPPQPVLPRLGASITGGYVYRGSAIPALQGKYVFGDYATNGISGGGGILLGVEEVTPGVFTLSGSLPIHNALPASARIYCFGTDEAGEIYFATKTTSGVEALDAGKPAGTLYKILPLPTATLDLTSNRDNTMYEEGKSNGKGPHIYAGRIGDVDVDIQFMRRRALLRFDLSTIPVGASLTSASVTLTTTKAITQDVNHSLHKVTADWGEGTSNAGEPGGKGALPTTNDATWTRRFHNTLSWTTAGGDFVSTASATSMVGNILSAPKTTWGGAGILADVQSWLSTPSSNYGWALIGKEDVAFNGFRYASRENAVVADRPKLTIGYTAVPQPTRYETWFAAHFPGSPPGTYLNPKGDNDGDGISNQIEYAYGFSPLSYNPPGSDQFSTELVPSFDDSTDYTITFRRDSSATDLTYNLQTSEDLIGWTTIATSAGGALTTGDNGGNVLSDSPVSGSIRLVTVSENLAAGSNEKRFVRLEVLRTP
jgi:hypothetical protein